MRLEFMDVGKHGMSSEVRLRDVWTVYTKIGVLGFGGGFAVLSFIRAETVERHHWLTDEQFDHIIEFTAFSPGATTINVMAAIAYRLRGVLGVLIGISAVLWPSFLLILGLATVTSSIQSPWLHGALTGIEAAVVGLLVVVVRSLFSDLPRKKIYPVIAVLAGLLTIFGMNPAFVVLLAALSGMLAFSLRRRTMRVKEKHPRWPK